MMKKFNISDLIKVNPGRKAIKSKGSILDKVIIFIASGAYTGFSPIAPGTVGTLAACILYLIIIQFGLRFYYMAVAAIIPLAIITAHLGVKMSDHPDPAWIVIDEIAGYLLSLIILPYNLWMVILAFLVFRFFDIVKPYPIRLLERKIPGGLGVVADDLAAGIYTGIFIWVFLKIWYPV